MGMIELLIIAAGVTACFLFVMFIGARGQEKAKNMPMPDLDWSALQDELVQDEIARGRKIEAVKRYRELTGSELKEAKEALNYAMAHPEEIIQKRKPSQRTSDAGLRDLIEEGRIEETVETYRLYAGVDVFSAQEAVQKITLEMQTEDEITDTITVDEAALLDLVEAGRKIEAIRLYREQTGSGLAEAKEAVESLKRGSRGA